MVQTEGFEDALGAGYRLLDRRGRGAAGEVWRAVDRRTDEVVAAKLLRSEHVADRDLVGRFIRERSILTTLRHPNIVAVRDLVVEGDRLAIVMDFVDGGSLRDVLREDGPLPPALAVGVAAAVLDGLAGAHDQGVLHRDIKPDNVLLSEGWRDLRPGDVKLTDFGIARIVADGAGTTTGLLGTPEYMSPGAAHHRRVRPVHRRLRRRHPALRAPRRADALRRARHRLHRGPPPRVERAAPAARARRAVGRPRVPARTRTPRPVRPRRGPRRPCAG